MAYERVREAQLAAAWAAGAWRGQVVRAEDGVAYLVLFEGRRGGNAGPDFRDAVLLRGDGARLTGDVELHLRPEGWVAHGHATDPRYDGLALHVVLSSPRLQRAEGPSLQGTPLASGRTAPLVILGSLAPPHPATAPPWPCAALGSSVLRERVSVAGKARFERRVEALTVALEDVLGVSTGVSGGARWSAADRVLWPELAEALAYGRDRIALRVYGDRLAAGVAARVLREEAQALPRVERDRVRGLLALADRWDVTGPVDALAALLGDGQHGEADRADGRAPEVAGMGDATERGRHLTRALVVAGGSISPGRAAIVVVNVVLPFLAAWGAVARDAALAGRACAVYAALPGLPANTITRTMVRHLGLRQQPRGALAQQGLQEVWRVACREKRCVACPLNVGLGASAESDVRTGHQQASRPRVGIS